MRVVDACGLACPKPVLLTKEALEAASEGEVFRVVVDNAAAKENVLRFVKSRGAEAEVVEEKEGRFVIEARKGGKMAEQDAERFEVVCSVP